MLVSPFVGFGLAFALMLAIMWGFRHANPHKTNRGFRSAQTLSAAAMALGHGLQDAQKHGRHLPSTADRWLCRGRGPATGVGDRVGRGRDLTRHLRRRLAGIRTLGRRIIHLDPARGFAAESCAAGVLYVSAIVFHAPISTTHTITSAIAGAGATRRLWAVRWGVARGVLIASGCSPSRARGWQPRRRTRVLTVVLRLPSDRTWAGEEMHVNCSPGLPAPRLSQGAHLAAEDGSCLMELVSTGPGLPGATTRRVPTHCSPIWLAWSTTTAPMTVGSRSPP